MSKKAIESTRIADVSTAIDAGGLVLTFADGRKLDLRLSRLSTDIATQAMMHGLKQKLVDAAAIGRNPDTGRSASLDDKFEAVREVYLRLLGGEWNKAREGDGTGGMGLLVAALLSLYPAKTKGDIVAYLDGLTPEQQKALRLNAKVAAAIAEVKAKRAGADAIDSDELLGGLE